MRTRSQQGFTLIEILTVIIIIGILTSVLLPTVISARTRARVAATKADLATFGTAAEAFKADAGIYPPDDYSKSGICGLIFGVIRYDSASMTLPGTGPSIYKDIANESTRCPVFWLGSTFWIQSKTLGPYMMFKQNRLARVVTTYTYYYTSCTAGPGNIRWSFTGPGQKETSYSYAYVAKDFFGNNYVYDSHFPESKLILMSSTTDTTHAHNLLSFDMFSFGPTYHLGTSGLVDDYDNPPPNPGEAADDINNWQ